MKKLRKSAVCLILSLLLALSACGTAPEEPALPSPDAEGVATPAPTPTPEPTPTPDPVLTRAEELLAGMSLREKLCQLMIVRRAPSPQRGRRRASLWSSTPSAGSSTAWTTSSRRSRRGR